MGGSNLELNTRLINFWLIQLSAIPGTKPLSNKKQNFQEKVKPNKCRVQSSVS